DYNAHSYVPSKSKDKCFTLMDWRLNIASIIYTIILISKMGILLKQVRVHGFRGLDNIEVDFDPTSVIVGTNNAGKTTLLKSLQLALTNSIQITDDDFFISDDVIRTKIIIDLLFISVNAKGNQLSEFDDKWATIFTTNRITIDSEGNQLLSFRTIIKENR